MDVLKINGFMKKQSLFLTRSKSKTNVGRNPGPRNIVPFTERNQEKSNDGRSATSMDCE